MHLPERDKYFLLPSIPMTYFASHLEHQQLKHHNVTLIANVLENKNVVTGIVSILLPMANNQGFYAKKYFSQIFLLLLLLLCSYKEIKGCVIVTQMFR